MKSTVEWTRAILAVLALLALIAAAGLAYFYGSTLSGPQISLLTMIVTMIGNKAASAFSYFFDGSPDKPSTKVGVPDPTQTATLTLKATP